MKNTQSNKVTDCGEISAIQNAIEVQNAGIYFKRPKRRTNNQLQRSLTSVFKRNSGSEVFWALKNITFCVRDGDIVGIVGPNGAGKSTLLKLLVGVLVPDEGHIQTNGRISALLALGAGFMSDLSGRENIYLNSSYMGLKKHQIDAVYNQIVAFAELEEFIETPLRYYSSGMKARLGFSVAVHSEPEILIIDEVLSAGDKNFRIKAEKKMREFLGKAKAIVIASHSTKMITDLCNKCLWIEKGKIRMSGSSTEVVSEYLES